MASTAQRDFSSANKEPLVVNTPVPIMLATTRAVALIKPSGRSRTLFVATFIDCPPEWRPLLNGAGGANPVPWLLSLFRENFWPLGLFLDSFGSSHGNEAHRQHGSLLDLLSAFLQQIKLLVVLPPHWNDHPAPVLQLVDQSLRHMVRRTGHNNRIEGRSFRPPLVTIAGTDLHLPVTQSLQVPLGPTRQRFHNFDRVHFRHQRRENRRLVAGASADFKDAIRGFGIEPFGHERHDERLGDRLAVADGQRTVCVSCSAVCFGHKLVSRHRRHRLQHLSVGDVPARSFELFFHHLSAQGYKIRVRSRGCGSEMGPIDQPDEEEQEQPKKDFAHNSTNSPVGADLPTAVEKFLTRRSLRSGEENPRT